MLKVNERVQRTLYVEGISTEELEQMIKHSAITSVAGFNRRYHKWLFQVKDDTVWAMVASEPVTFGVNRGMGFDEMECDECSGVGCKTCGWVGKVRYWRSPRTR